MLTTIELRKRYVIYLRAILSLMILLVGLYNYSKYPIDPFSALLLVSLLVLSNVAFLAVPARYFKGIKLHYLIFILDIAFLVVGANIFSNLSLTFLIAVFLTIFMAALSQSVGVSLVIALVVDAVYVYLLYLSYRDTGFDLLSNDRALVNLPFIFIVALHSSYLAEKANEELSEKQTLEKVNLLLTKKIVSKSELINAVTQFNESFMDSFREGIIILDDEGSVKLLNGASEKLFGIKRDTAVNSPVKDLPLPDGIKTAIMNLRFKDQPVDGLAFDFTPGGPRGAVTTSFIRNKNLESIGILCAVREVK